MSMRNGLAVNREGSRSVTYNPNADVLTATDALGVGNTTASTYNADNSPTSITLTTGATARAEYPGSSSCASSDADHPYPCRR